jgi:alkylation response protein AidB-like acyl-CoA dehydrogenase
VDFSFSDEARAFGDRVRTWLRRELRPDWESAFEPTSPEWIEFQRNWDRKLYAAGWGAIFWPTEHGGLSADLETRVMFAKVMAEAGAPDGLAKIGKRLVAPVLMHHGTAEQKARFLPPLLRGQEFWAQGFSEPGSGSDLASLTTRGVVDGDRLLVTGQKIWTSHAWYCDWIFALVRTSQESQKQRGITFIVFPTDHQGVSIRPIDQINGRSEFSEVFLDEAPIPMEWVVGPIGEGWQIAKSLLEYERGAEMSLGRAAQIRAATTALTADLWASLDPVDAGVASRLGRLQAQFVGAEVNTLRLLGEQMTGGEPGPLSAVVKLQQTEDWRAATAEHLRFLGPAALQGRGDHFERFFSSRSATIASGSSEVQRNIIARRVLGLPT